MRFSLAVSDNQHLARRNSPSGEKIRAVGRQKDLGPLRRVVESIHKHLHCGRVQGRFRFLNTDQSRIANGQHDLECSQERGKRPQRPVRHVSGVEFQG